MKTRKVKTKIWRDEWYLNLSRASKILFVFLFTNEYMGLSGFVEIPDSLICFHTGLTQSELTECKRELYPKVKFAKGWVYVVNLLEHDPIEGGETNNVYKAYIKELETLPDDIRQELEAPPKPLKDSPMGVKAKAMVKEQERESVREKTKHDEELSVLVAKHNELYKTKITATHGFASNYAFWRQFYSAEQILYADNRMRFHPYWWDKTDLVKLLRIKGKNQEDCDRISEAINAPIKRSQFVEIYKKIYPVPSTEEEQIAYKTKAEDLISYLKIA